MFRFTMAFLAGAILIGSCPAWSEENPVRTCTLSRGYECIPAGCKEWPVKDFNLPRFIRIDLKNKTITSLDRKIPTNSGIQAVEEIPGMTVLLGVEKRGWTIALGKDSSSLSLSIAGDEEAFVLFGACLNP